MCMPTYRFQMKKIVVYKVLIGEYDHITKEMYSITRDSASFAFDYVLISDMNITVPHPWKLMIIDRKFQSPAVENRFYKINVPEEFNSYDYTVYLDSNISIINDLNPMMEMVIADNNYIYAYPHFRDTTIREEIINCFIFSKINYCQMFEARRFLKEKLNKKVGFECSVLIRKKVDKKLTSFHKTWFDLYLNHVKRDQLYFATSLEDNGIACKSLGVNNIRDGKGLFLSHSHKSKITVWKKIYIAIKMRIYRYDISKK